MSESNTQIPWLVRLERYAYSSLWLRTGAGVIAGLFCSRLFAEQSAGPWAWRYLALLILGCSLVGGLISAWLGRGHRWYPLLLLAIYLPWPAAQPAVAMIVLGLCSILLLMLNPPAIPSGFGLATIVFVAALGLYVATLAPSILPADSGEFQLTSAVLGIAHPPGYSLYILLGKLFTLLPLGDIAYRVNLMSAVFSALTLSVLCYSLERHTHSRTAALTAVILLGTSSTFWAQSTTANIRSLTTLLTTLCLATLLAWGENQRPRTLVLFAICFGLGVGHHTSIALFAVPFGAYILCTSPRLLLQPRRWLPPLGTFLATFVVLLYLPLRSAMQPAFDPAPIRSWGDFWGHVLALGFRGDLFYFNTWQEITTRLDILGQILTLQFGSILPIIGGLAVIPLVRKSWRIALLLGGSLITNALAAITYRAPQTVEYLLPAYLALVWILAYGLGEILHWPRMRLFTQLAGATILMLVVGNSLVVARSAVMANRDNAARLTAESWMQAAPQNALILANWHQATPLWFLQLVENKRPYIIVEYVNPQGATPYEQTWLDRIAAEVGKRPLLITNWFYALNSAPYSFTPLASGWQVNADPLVTTPVDVKSVEIQFTEGISVLGYSLTPETATAGGTATFVLAWRSEQALAQDLTSFVQVLGPDGVVGQDDQLHSGGQMGGGQVQVDRFQIPLLPQALPGQYRVIVGFYTKQNGAIQRLLSEGQDAVVVQEVELRAGQALLPSLHPLAISWENGLHLNGYDVDNTVAGQTRLYLHLYIATQDQGLGLPGPRKSGGWQLQLVDGNQVMASKAMPSLPIDGYLLVAMDIPTDLQRVAVRLLGTDGQSIAPLGPWHRPLQRDVTLVLPRQPATYIPLGGDVVFIGAAVIRATTQRSDSILIEPRFLSNKPLIQDITVSVGLRTANGWEIKDDGTPALGAIPTLKWGWGWLVSDPHQIMLPADAPQGQATLTLELYDAFNLQPLAVLDERLVRIGQGTRLEIGQIEMR
ncbi:MAG: protein O-mannosyl-transferase family [Anaerolineae bacterium]